MFNTERKYIPVLLLVSFTWISSSQGGFTEEQVRKASSVIVGNDLIYSKPSFVPIIIQNRPELNGVAMSPNAIKSDIASTGNAVNLTYILSISDQKDGLPEFYELHHDAKEYIVLITDQEPDYSKALKLKVSNENEGSTEVNALPVEGKFTAGGGEHFVVIFERSELGTFIWKDSTEVTGTAGGSDVEGGCDYEALCFNPPIKPHPQDNENNVYDDVSIWKILTQKSTTPLVRSRSLGSLKQM